MELEQGARNKRRRAKRERKEKKGQRRSLMRNNHKLKDLEGREREKNKQRSKQWNQTKRTKE